MADKECTHITCGGGGVFFASARNQQDLSHSKEHHQVVVIINCTCLYIVVVGKVRIYIYILLERLSLWRRLWENG